MKAGIDEERIDEKSQQNFAQNRLVIIYPKENPRKFSELVNLSTPGLNVILAAKEEPVGQYSLEFLDKAAQDPIYGPTLKETVIENLVSYEVIVKNLLTKALLGEGDGRIVYSSDITPTATGK
ncbi:MAG: solute-binding protein [Anaerolineae bacterium]|nr:solute-binding protein [Anaerolineae bacterium]